MYLQAYHKNCLQVSLYYQFPNQNQNHDRRTTSRTNRKKKERKS